MSINLKIYVANLGAYNRGFHVGKWIELPCSNLDEELADILNGEEAQESDRYEGEIDEETAIHDYESDFSGLEIGEYDNISELNELAERLDKLQDWEIKILQAIVEVEGDLDRAIETYEKGDYLTLHNVNDEKDLGYAAVEEGLFGIEIPENLQNYIDYESIGRDFTMDGWTICSNGIAICRS